MSSSLIFLSVDVLSLSLLLDVFTVCLRAFPVHFRTATVGFLLIAFPLLSFYSVILLYRTVLDFFALCERFVHVYT